MHADLGMMGQKVLITKSWKNPPLTWRMAANQFAIQFGERFNK